MRLRGVDQLRDATHGQSKQSIARHNRSYSVAEPLVRQDQQASYSSSSLRFYSSKLKRKAPASPDQPHLCGVQCICLCMQRAAALTTTSSPFTTSFASILPPAAAAAAAAAANAARRTSRGVPTPSIELSSHQSTSIESIVNAPHRQMASALTAHSQSHPAQRTTLVVLV